MCVHRNAKYLFVSTLSGSFNKNIAVSHLWFYSRVNPAESSLILQWRRVNVKPLDVLDQSSTTERFLCNSSINIEYRCVYIDEIVVGTSDVESPFRLELDVALLDVAVVYRFRFSRRDPRAFGFRLLLPSYSRAFLSLTPSILSLPAPGLPHALFTARPSSSWPEHPTSEFVTRSTMDDFFFAHAGSIDTLVVFRDRSDDFVLSYNAALPREGFAAALLLLRIAPTRVSRRRCNAQKNSQVGASLILSFDARSRRRW